MDLNSLGASTLGTPLARWLRADQFHQWVDPLKSASRAVCRSLTRSSGCASLINNFQKVSKVPDGSRLLCPHIAISALPPKADIRRRGQNVCFVSIGDGGCGRVCGGPPFKRAFICQPKPCAFHPAIELPLADAHHPPGRFASACSADTMHWCILRARWRASYRVVATLMSCSSPIGPGAQSIPGNSVIFTSRISPSCRDGSK